MQCSLSEWFFGARLGMLCGGRSGGGGTNAPDDVIESHSTAEPNGNATEVAEEKTVSDSFQEEDLQNILVQVARENGFQKPKYEVTSATKAGDNYLGRVERAVIRESGPHPKEKLSVIFKIAPASKARREVFRTGAIFTHEANMYQRVFPALNSFLKEYGLSTSDTYPNIPRCLAAKLSQDFNENAEDVLVLEDMAPQGYAMLDRAVGLDVDVCRIVLRELAVLHATSLALRHLRPDDARELESTAQENFFVPDNPMLPEMTKAVSLYLSYVEDRYPKGTPEYNKLKDIVDNYADVMCNAVLPNDQLSCFVHGDCWTNNILFKRDESGNVEKACLIDFQMSRLTSPALDLVHFFFTSTTKELRDAHYQSLLQGYHAKLTSALLSLGCDPEEIMPWSLLQQQLQRYGIYGMGFSMMVIPLFLTDSSDIQDIDRVIDEGDGLASVVLKNESGKREIQKRLSDILQDCVEYGYL